MYIRYQRAAVAAEESHSPRNRANPVQSVVEPTQSEATRVLWANTALSIRGGRLVGVRLIGRSVEVAFIKQDSDHIKWVVADTVLTDFQASMWLKASKFGK